MRLKKLIESWKYPFILLFAIGISNLGAWIYLIALNLSVLEMTEGSALAVAGLYITKPLATMFTNVWSGSFIDRLNKRSVLVFLDIFRAALIAVLPFFSSLWVIYLLVFILGMAGSIFSPASMAYITMLLNPEQRKRFNAFRSLINSGAFLVGPAIAGLLFVIGTPTFALFINAIALFLSGLLTLLLPNLEKQEPSFEKVTLDLLKKDLDVVRKFSRNNLHIMKIYLVFGGIMVLATSLDSLEAAFAIDVLNLSQKDYGFLVSIAGAGIVVGSITTALFAERLSIAVLMGVGSVMVSIGYIIYSFSHNFLMAGIGFFILAFFLAFANTGFQTFYQNNIPVHLMGRVGSIYGLVDAFFIIVMTLIFGVAAQLFSIQSVVIAGAFGMLLISIILCIFNSRQSISKCSQ